MIRLYVTVLAICAVVAMVVSAAAQGETILVEMGTPVTWTFNATPATTATTIRIVDNPNPGPTALFEPDPLEIAPGTTVIWTHLDEGAANIRHTATADDLDGAGNPIFDSGVLVLNDSYAHTFDTTGDFTYFCAIHPNMTGTVSVN